MLRFDVYSRPGQTGYLLDVQADLLGLLNTRVVVPLLPMERAPTPADRLNPTFEIGGIDVSILTQFMAAVPKAELKNHVLTLESKAAEIIAAIDFLHQGW